MNTKPLNHIEQAIERWLAHYRRTIHSEQDVDQEFDYLGTVDAGPERNTALSRRALELKGSSV
jgi:hypothetical protein